jgi:probable rRNA maturation factor
MIVYEPAVELKLPRAARPRRRELARFLRQAIDAIGLAGDVSVLLTGDEAIRTLNRNFRRKDKATDVLSFPAAEGMEGVAGDLAISLETAFRQAKEHQHTLEMEIKVLLLHGLLHLAGYDHETDNGTMHRKEVRLRRELGLTAALIERTQRGHARQGRVQQRRVQQRRAQRRDSREAVRA